MVVYRNNTKYNSLYIGVSKKIKGFCFKFEFNGPYCQYRERLCVEIILLFISFWWSNRIDPIPEWLIDK